MRRTQRRPLARHAVTPRAALIFGIVLGGRRDRLAGVHANLLAAVLAAPRIAFYVFVYTLWLKRRTSQNIVCGGAAGCVAGAHRVVRRHRDRRLAGVVLFAGRLLLDAAALLGTGDAVPGRLRARPACRCCRWWPPAEVVRQIVLYSWAMVPARWRWCRSARTTGSAGSTRRLRRPWAPGSSSRRTGCSAASDATASDDQPMKLFHVSISLPGAALGRRSSSTSSI